MWHTKKSTPENIMRRAQKMLALEEIEKTTHRINLPIVETKRGTEWNDAPSITDLENICEAPGGV